jgi:signal peptidase
MWYIILGLLGLIYFTINYILSGGLIESYIVRPALWIILAVLTFIIAKNEGINFIKFKRIRRWTFGKSPIHAGLLLGGFQVALLIIIGIFFTFGKSPYSFSIITIITNLFFVCSLLVGTEFSRAYLIKKATKNQRKNQTLSIIIITIIFMIILTAPSKFSNIDLNNPAKTLEFLGGTLIVALAVNLLATYLSYLGGATASMSYMGVLLAFEWFSPILPNPNWTILALIGTIAPALGFIVLQGSIEPFIEKRKRFKHKKQRAGHGWTLIAVFSLIFIFFSYGYLGVEPTVIYSGSMRPALDVGDIVLIDKVEVSSIEVGDIIQYVSEEKVLILHRVEEKYQDEKGQWFFITKGDANEKSDLDPVMLQNVKGKAVFTLPKLGWVQIYVKEFFRSITAPFIQGER